MIPISFALLAAALYAINIPLSKILLTYVAPISLASLLYLGAGLGMLVLSALSPKRSGEPRLTRRELPYTIGMILLDILAPIALMQGLETANSANASLMNNFEIVATSVIALSFFKETVSRRMWVAIALITFSSALLSFEGSESLKFSPGSIWILFACLCWGFENNCTKMMASKSTKQIVILKGIFSGIGSLIVAILARESFPEVKYILATLALGFVSYGLSIFFYVKAQGRLGAAKTSSCYAIAPFIGALFSFVMLHERLSRFYACALIIMVAGTAFIVRDSLSAAGEKGITGK